MSASVRNPYADAKRREKAKRLTNVLDLACVQQLKLDPIRDGAKFAIRLATMSEEGWVKAAAVAKVNLPSAETRALVIDGYFERAQLDVARQGASL